jgi:phosphopantothenoylcysteine synthetase/decarboxylase
LPAFVQEAQASGWEVCVIATPSALKFMDLDHLARLTGHVVRYDYKQPDEPDVLPPADAMVVAPATFNTINKWATGISDTLALGLLNEAVGLGLPVVAVPFPNIALAQHPAFRRSMAELEALGVRLVFDPDTDPLPTPNLGPASRELFPWQALREELAKLTAQLAP